MEHDDILGEDIMGSNVVSYSSSVTSSIVYGLIGFILLVLCYFIFDKLTSINFRREIRDENNTSAAILAGSLLIAVGIIISSAIS